MPDPIVPAERPPAMMTGGLVPAQSSPHARADKLARAGMPTPPPAGRTTAGLVIDASHRILQVDGEMLRYLQPAAGPHSQQLADNLHPALRGALRKALAQARELPEQSVSADAELDGRRLRLTVQPLRRHAGVAATLQVLFEDIGAPAALPVGMVAETPGTTGMSEIAGVTGARLQSLDGGDDSADAAWAGQGEASLRELLQRLDESLRVNQELRQLIDANDIATIFVDAELRIRHYTPHASELFNLIPSDVGRPLLHITHRFDYDELAQDARTALHIGRRVEREIEADDGRQFIARLLPCRSGEHRLEGAVISFVDISELRSTQQEVMAGGEQLRLAAESTSDFAILTIDEAGLIRGWNLGAELMFGYLYDEVVGQSYSIIFTDEDRAAGIPEQELAQARTTGRGEDERWHRRKSGSVFYCSGATTRLNGEPGYAKIARDLTRSQQSALARENLLSREQEDRREVEATMEAKELFLAVMSHELKHPLNLIHLNAELLSRMPEVRNLPAASRAARIIQQTVAGQARIVDDLLDLSRARTGKLKLDRAPVDWVETVRRIVEAVRPEAQHKGVKLHFECRASVTLSLFDPVRAEQVVWNLLSNALKFTPPDGSVRVLLAVEDDMARLSVTDTGRGIHSAYINQVFEMFSQEPGLNRPDEGMGIGLALVRELVQAHGGRIVARSEGPGRGAEFSMWVPLHHGEAPAVYAVEQPSVLSGLRMLVVDDSADTADTLALLLGISGAHVSSAYTGKDALDMLALERFDVLLSDVSMPGMTGHELVAKLRARQSAQAPILALACSGYGRAQDERHAIEAGFDALLPKPVPLEQVEHAVERLMARRRAAAG